MKIYLASTLQKNKRGEMEEARDILVNQGHSVYVPGEQKIDGAWEYSNQDWARLVFEADIRAIKECDVVVMLSQGRKSTAGVNWEAGYAYGIGKKVIVVEMTNKPMSLMVSNGGHAVVEGLAGLCEYDWSGMPRLRTETEQK